MYQRNTTAKGWRPPSWIEEGQVEGGFAFVPTASLMACWNGYKSGRLKLRDVRAWVGIVEMVERRTASDSERTPQYDLKELSRLTGVQVCRGAIRRLSDIGVVEWSREQVRLTGPTGSASTRRKWVPVPRRILRWLAQHGTAAEIATAFGHASRCLFYDSMRKVCRSGGYCTAQWVAEHFGVGERSVKRARSAWISRKWLRMVEDGKSGHRTGARFIIEFAWRSPHRLAPQTSSKRAPLAPPRDQQDPPSEIKQPDRESGTQRPVYISHIVPEDLSDPARLAEIHRQAGLQGLVPKSQAGALLVFSAAARAKRCAERNPCGMFATILRKQLWNHICSIDEDAARCLFKRRPLANVLPPRRSQDLRSSMSQQQIRELVRSAIELRTATLEQQSETLVEFPRTKPRANPGDHSSMLGPNRPHVDISHL